MDEQGIIREWNRTATRTMSHGGPERVRQRVDKLAGSGVREVRVEDRRPRGADATCVRQHERARQLAGEKWRLVY
jgi:hypothetical protein